MVGIKGTGMTALAEVLCRRGVAVSGSDVPERFYTDDILSELSVSVIEDFSAEWLPEQVDRVIHSAAYRVEAHPQLQRARERGIPIATYPEALGALSADCYSVGVAGVHGKTTTSAMIGVLVQALGLPGSVIVGSAVAGFGGRSTLAQGERFLVAETCEYQRHFLAFHPDAVVLTSVEPDHLDYYRDLADVESAFCDYLKRLPNGGTVIYCADDSGAGEVVRRVAADRPDLQLCPYGESAAGRYRLHDCRESPGLLAFQVGERSLRLRVPGRHNALNAAAAIAAADLLAERFPAQSSTTGPKTTAAASAAAGLAEALSAFAGTRRRAEIVGEAGGVLFMDDYAHHPTAIRTTLSGIRAFYPDRRLICDFMSHTYSRTAALLDDFASAFGDADIVVLHRIYASAREQFDGEISGGDLAAAMRRKHGDVRYYDDPDESVAPLTQMLQPGDLFLTMGAGDNWRLGRKLLAVLEESAR